MAIHGIVSTYFGDLEYDLGKSLNWTSYFCDSMYIMDVNTADASRRYVVDWDKQVPHSKYSFATDVQYFGSPSRAAAWRAESFRRADEAWNYKPDDWVLFIDGTEALNVYHVPPVTLTITDVEIDQPTGQMTFITSAPHIMEAGSRITITGAYIDFPGSNSAYYEHSEAVATDTWVVEHGLHLRPSITALTTDPEYTPLDVSVTHVDRDTTVLTFPEPVTGDVTLSIAAVDPAYVLLDGSYDVLAVDTDTFTVAPCFEVDTTVGTYDDVLMAQAQATYTTEPVGYHTGDLFQSWIDTEIAAAEDDGKTRISLDSWAMIRSSVPEEVEFKVLHPAFLTDSNGRIAIPGARVDQYGDVWVSNPRCSEYYLSMSRLVRLVKVSTLRDPEFDWQSLDQSASVPTGAYPAERLSLISYAYIRWAENAIDMTQGVDPDAPNYVVGDEAAPPFRPLSVESDVGFAMRRLISTVRPVVGAPTEWESTDDAGEQPQVSSYEKLDTVWVEQSQYSPSIVNDTVIVAETFSGYRQYGGTPLYPGVLRANRREGVWYVASAAAPLTLKVSSYSYNETSTLVTVNTAKAHPLSVGDRISLYGTLNSDINGQYEVFSVPGTQSFTFKRAGLVGDIELTDTPLASAVRIPADFGPIPWNYLLNGLGITGSPKDWVQSGSTKSA